MKSRKVKFSQDVEMASIAVNQAMDNLRGWLEKSYPLGEFVRVIHPRGEYTGVVIGHDEYGARVVIENDISGKVSRRYFRHVEREGED